MSFASFAVIFFNRKDAKEAQRAQSTDWVHFGISQNAKIDF